MGALLGAVEATESVGIVPRLVSLLGVGVIVGLAYAMSTRRDAIKWRPVLWGIGLQFVFGVLVLNPTVSSVFYGVVDGAVNKLLEFSARGGEFVFGSFVPHQIADASGELQPSDGLSPPMVNLAFTVLPTIIFFSALTALLYQLGVMQIIVRGIAVVMVRTMGTSGAESLSAAGNIFLGQTEAPLLVRPFINRMTASELNSVMTCGFATVAGGVLGAYVSFLRDVPNIAGHLVMASIMAAPGALALSKVVVPETEEPVTRGDLGEPPKSTASNAVEAVAVGASDGVKLAINVAAMLIAMVALVYLVDWTLGVVPVRFCDESLSWGYGCAEGAALRPLGLSDVLGAIFAPLAAAIGVPLDEVSTVGRLLGEKLALTEFIAYEHLGSIVANEPGRLSERTVVMCSFALCGFANFASIGIQLGGIGGMAPERLTDLSRLGVRAMLTGALVSCMSAAIVGVIWS